MQYYYFNDKDEDEARKIVMDALVANGNIVGEPGN